jgi:hypothetical protein
MSSRTDPVLAATLLQTLFLVRCEFFWIDRHDVPPLTSVNPNFSIFSLNRAWARWWWWLFFGHEEGLLANFLVVPLGMPKACLQKTRALGDLLNSSAGPKLAFGCASMPVDLIL